MPMPTPGPASSRRRRPAASAAGFVAVALGVGGCHAPVARVVAADAVAPVLLAAGLVAALRPARQRGA